MKTRLAVLVDTDNISAEHAPAVVERAAALGLPVVRRLYGRPSSTLPWDAATQNEVYELRPQTSLTSAKNGADIALAVGAMDILYAGWVDAFCIVSNDRDFVPLATRLRASRMKVHAICTQFDGRLLKVFDTVFQLNSVHPIVAAFQQIMTDKVEFGLAEAGKLLREVAPPDVVPPPGKGRLRKALEKTEQFVFTGSGASMRVRLRAA